MGLFGLWKRRDEDGDEPEVLDEEEYIGQLEDEALYVDDIPLESTVVTVRPRDTALFDTDAFLEVFDRLPYEFRVYYDTRRAFRRAFDSLREELSYYESYEGGRSAEYSEDYEFDDHDVVIFFTLSRESNNSPFIFEADIRIDDPSAEK